MKHPLASLFVILFLVSVSVSGGELHPANEDVQTKPWAGQYRYDGTGNIKAIGTNQYVYDGAGRLITATMTAGVKAYTYDEFGNLVRVISNGDGAHATVAGVNRSTNRIDDATPCTPGTACIIASFDAAGNQTTGPAGAQYQYDPLNMMTELSVVARHDIYIYDADDERIATVNDAGAASRVWHYTLRDAGASVIREWDDSVSGTTHTWTWTKDYVHRGAALLATLASSEGSEIRTHFHLDHLGTPRLLTDDFGRKVSIHTYWPFGQETPDSDQNAEARKFTGHERDFAGLGNDNDLDYMHARFYGPAMGRFLSADPVIDVKRALTNPQMWNRYAYVANNPLNRIDPDGRLIRVVGTDEERKQAFDLIKANLREQDRKYVTMNKNGIISVNAKAKGGVGLSMLRDLASKDVQTVNVKLGSTFEVKSGPGPSKPQVVDLQTAAGGGFTTKAAFSVSGNIEVNVDPRGSLSTGAPASLVMGHELIGHAWDYVFKGKSSERSAVTTETNLLLQLGLPQFRPVPTDHDQP